MTEQAKCLNCGRPIMQERNDDPFVHVDTEVERCSEDRDDFATPDDFASSAVRVPRIDIVVFRDTDSATEVEIFIDGVKDNSIGSWTFDNGNSSELSSIREGAHDALNNPETDYPQLRETLRAGYQMEQDGTYVEDDSAPCTICGTGVTEYPSYRTVDVPLVGYLDDIWSLAGDDGHAHTAAPVEAPAAKPTCEKCGFDIEPHGEFWRDENGHLDCGDGGQHYPADD